MRTRTHWTFSSYKDHSTCPKRYEFAYLSDLPKGPTHPAAQRGIDIHTAIERYLLGQTATIEHPEVRPTWLRHFTNLKLLRAVPEEQWEFDAGWNPWSPNLDDQPLWLRMKLDAHHPSTSKRHGVAGLVVIDFKTGGIYPVDHDEQMEVYALGALARHDDIDNVTTALWYLDHDDFNEKTFTRPEASKLARKWEGRAAKVLDAKTFPAKPGRHCGWCPFKALCPDAA